MRDMPPVWKRSTYCSTCACVEVAKTATAVLLRDSKNPDQAPLAFTLAEWDGFQDRVLETVRSR